MTRDQRLVVSYISKYPSADINISYFQYQVHCIPEYNSDVSPLLTVLTCTTLMRPILGRASRSLIVFFL
jgi:hypothetical protein